MSEKKTDRWQRFKHPNVKIDAPEMKPKVESPPLTPLNTELLISFINERHILEKADFLSPMQREQLLAYLAGPVKRHAVAEYLEGLGINRENILEEIEAFCSAIYLRDSLLPSTSDEYMSLFIQLAFCLHAAIEIYHIPRAEMRTLLFNKLA